MPADRLLSILILLQLRQRLTAEALAEEFEVSVRTIYRDIDRLTAAGVPVYADRGPGGGFRLLDGYRTRLTGLAADEAEAMLMIGLPGPAAALGLGEAATAAQRKMLAALPRASGELAGRIAACFYLDPVDWYRSDETLPQLPAIARAVLDRRRLRMRYESWTGERDWIVEPLGLVLKAGAWYLVANGHGKPRIFKVANVRTVAVADAASDGDAGDGDARSERDGRGETFAPPADFELATWWSQALARFEAGLRPGLARLRASALGRKRLAQLGAFAEAAVHAGAPADADGWAELSLPIETLDHAALQLLGIGPELEVLQPPALRERLRALAQQAAARNG